MIARSASDARIRILSVSPTAVTAASAAATTASRDSNRPESGHTGHFPMLRVMPADTYPRCVLLPATPAFLRSGGQSRTMADGPDACLSGIFALPGDEQWGIDRAGAGAVPGVTVYAIRSFDGDALRFSLPAIVRRPLLREIPLDPRGAPGAVALAIERIKQQASAVQALGPLVGRGTRFLGRPDPGAGPARGSRHRPLGVLRRVAASLEQAARDLSP
jgi:hypothetical protein